MNTITITTQGAQNIRELRAEAHEAINAVLNQKITNRNDGRIAQLGVNGRDKILSGEALKNL